MPICDTGGLFYLDACSLSPPLVLSATTNICTLPTLGVLAFTLNMSALVPLFSSQEEARAAAAEAQRRRQEESERARAQAAEAQRRKQEEAARAQAAEAARRKQQVSDWI